VVLVLFFCSTFARGQFEFGAEEHPTAGGEVLIVEDFSSVLGFDQRPVAIGFLDCGIAPGIYDEEDALYLHVGPGPIRIADIRLTDSPFGAAGSKVGPTDGDFGLDLSSFVPPYPRIVYADLGNFTGIYDLNDSVYVKTGPPISEINVGDVRLTPAGPYETGTMVRGFDRDRGSGAQLLHPGPDFAFWPPAARGQVRFYNTKGNLFEDQLSLPSYDASDQVYFDVSDPSDPPRLFGHVAVPPRAGVIGDFVWEDANANGIQDDGEDSGISGVEVYLFDEYGYLRGMDITDNGSYRFEGLPSGNYYVYVNMSSLPDLDDGARWWPTEPNVGDNDSVDSDGLLVDEDAKHWLKAHLASRIRIAFPSRSPQALSSAPQLRRREEARLPRRAVD